MIIEFDLDIPSLTEEGIQLNPLSFGEVRELVCSSMIDELLMIEMLILLIDSFDRDFVVSNTINQIVPILMNQKYHLEN